MPDRRSVLTALGASGLVASIGAPARAIDGPSGSTSDVVAVLGTGHFGTAIGKRLAARGYRVIYGSRTPDSARVKALVQDSGLQTSVASQRDAVSRSGIVVLAVPWASVKGMLPELDLLSGKLIIDPMIASPKVVNKLPFPPDPALSAAEVLQGWTPGGHVVSAFSTIAYTDLADPGRAGGPMSIPLAGDDAGANARVARLIRELGLDPVIVGNLTAARYIESLLWLEVACNSSIYNRGTSEMFEIYLRRVPLRK